MKVQVIILFKVLWICRLEIGGIDRIEIRLEFLRLLTLMGVGTGPDGRVIVTDMDRIEVSNLSRQFLFRQPDVGHPKSVRGALAVQKWNPSMNITALEKKVGEDTEDFFDDQFWESLHLCWNALDNVMARR